MKTHLACLATTSVALLAASAASQGVPRSAHLITVAHATATSTSNLLLTDGVSTCVPVTGSTALGLNAVQFDPIDKRVWVGSAAGAPGALRYLSINSTTVTAETLHSTVAAGRAITAITFDDDGNPVCTAARQVVRVNRNVANSNSLIFDFASLGLGGTVNCICRDTAGNLYVGFSPLGSIYKFTKKPDCTYTTPPTLIGNIMPASASGDITGLEFCPARGARQAALVWTSASSNGTAAGTFTLPTGPVAATSGVRALSAVDYDLLNDRCLVTQAGTANPRSVLALSKTLATSTVCMISNLGTDEMTGIDTSACGTAVTNIAPSCVTGPLTLEIGTCCSGGAAGVFLTSPALLTIATGVVDNTGRLSVKFPGLSLSAGFPGLLTFTSACLNTTTGALTIGPPHPWPAN